MRTFVRAGLGYCVFIMVVSVGAAGLRAADESRPTLDPAIYGRIFHLGWVVRDLDPILAYWEKLGVRNIQRDGVQDFPDTTYRGRKTPLSLKEAFCDFGGVEIEWIQPVKGHSVYDEFLSKHGDGIQHVAFFVRSPEVLEQQLKYFRARNVGVVQSGTWQGTKRLGHFAYLDTAPKGGGITIELCDDPDAPPFSSRVSPNAYPFNKVLQLSMLVGDLKQVASYYRNLGFGEMAVQDGSYLDPTGKFNFQQGWWAWTNVPFEWVQPVMGSNLYAGYLEAHGDGMHHIAFKVKSADEAMTLMGSKGAKLIEQGGSWTSPDGRGRFVYVDTQSNGGVVIELAWDTSIPK